MKKFGQYKDGLFRGHMLSATVLGIHQLLLRIHTESLQATLRGLKLHMFEWNYECSLTFAKLKETLCSAPFLPFYQDEG